MSVRSVSNRIAVDFNSLKLPISTKESLKILAKKNIRPIEVDVCSLAKDLVGNACWKLCARQWEAPYFFDCSSFIKWLYGQKGVWIPRRTLQQLDFCKQFGSLHSIEEVKTGDILFVSSPYINGVFSDSTRAVGHVCLAVDADNIICATNSEFGTGVVQTSLKSLLSSRQLACVGRIIDEVSHITTLIFPPEREIETPDDVRYIILQTLE